MSESRSRPRIGALALTFLAIAGGAVLFWSFGVVTDSRVTAADPEKYSPYVDDKGNIALPADYKTAFTHLGSFATATKVGGPVDQLHGVYARPEDVKAFQKDGKFPDGAVIVKDVYKVASENLTTGTVIWATDIDIWFVMVKDTKGRFKGNDLWGDGWGWALFKSGDPKKQVATDYATDCRACHVPAKKDDWLYVRGYPVLKDKLAAK